MEKREKILKILNRIPPGPDGIIYIRSKATLVELDCSGNYLRLTASKYGMKVSVQAIRKDYSQNEKNTARLRRQFIASRLTEKILSIFGDIEYTLADQPKIRTRPFRELASVTGLESELKVYFLTAKKITRRDCNRIVKRGLKRIAKKLSGDGVRENIKIKKRAR